MRIDVLYGTWATKPLVRGARDVPFFFLPCSAGTLTTSASGPRKSPGERSFPHFAPPLITSSKTLNCEGLPPPVRLAKRRRPGQHQNKPTREDSSQSRTATWFIFTKVSGLCGIPIRARTEPLARWASDQSPIRVCMYICVCFLRAIRGCVVPSSTETNESPVEIRTLIVALSGSRAHAGLSCTR